MKRLLVLSGLAVTAALGVASDAVAFGPTNCRDPWISQAIYQTYRRLPYANSPTTEECDITHYNGGHWNTYGDLVGYVRRVVPATPIMPVTPFNPGQGGGSLRMLPGTTVSAYTFNSLPQRNINGVRQVRLNNIWYVIAAGGGNVVAAGGGNLLSTNGGNVIAAGGGNVIAAGGGNVVAAGGGNVIAAGGGNVIAAGGGNITLYTAANQ